MTIISDLLELKEMATIEHPSNCHVHADGECTCGTYDHNMEVDELCINMIKEIHKMEDGLLEGIRRL